jgi:hypothetical protein
MSWRGRVLVLGYDATCGMIRTRIRERANGQNQEGARELRAAAVKRPHTRAAYAWAHGDFAWNGEGVS